MKRGVFLRSAGRFALGALWLVLSSCGGGGGSVPSPAPPTSAPGIPTATPTPTPSPAPAPAPSPSVELVTDANGWEIGPIIKGTNYSIGMPLRPTQNGNEWYFDFPLSQGSVHYLTYRFGSLSGRSRIVMKYRIEMDPGTLLHPPCCADMISVGPTPYFQRANDDWQTDGYRWWASYASPMPITPGEHEITVQLDGPWTSVFTKTAATDPSGFAKAKANAERIGFTFGGGDGLGHGLYADGSARFVLESFRVE
jgi:hypothetical protein